MITEQRDFVYPTGEGYDRFSDKGFCPEKPYKNFFDGIFSRFYDSIFYIHVIQCALVLLMYFNGNHGKYWKILLVASISGCIGAIFENFTVAYVCREGDLSTKRYHIVTFLLAEPFWATIEFSIPFLNLYKMKAFYDGKITKNLEYTIKFFFILFLGCRFFIGYERMWHGLLTTTGSKYGHMAAFTVMALADFICTVTIINYVRRHNREHPEVSKTFSVDHYIKRSCYLILICIDIVTVLLAILNGITELFGDAIPDSYLNPFHIVKCSFILILACDTLLFKFNLQAGPSNIDDFTDNYTFDEPNNVKSNNTALKSIVIYSETSRSIHNINKTCVSECSSNDIVDQKKGT